MRVVVAVALDLDWAEKEFDRPPAPAREGLARARRVAGDLRAIPGEQRLDEAAPGLVEGGLQALLQLLGASKPVAGDVLVRRVADAPQLPAQARDDFVRFF